MVTAIIIPIVLIYFYWLTKKEMKEHDAKWLATAEVPHEAIVKGKILNVREEKQRYYYHRYILVQILQLQTNAKTITAKKTSPIHKNMKKDVFNPGDVILLYGSWTNHHFLFSDFRIEHQ
ncbi:hypothetical protein [Neobacillus sp. LXY-1]|uniref:hypothetical protein n=1 Tax=Neobacillus sp. LXY-1 TaxID=3379133 RepID=UPI003EE140D2